MTKVPPITITVEGQPGTGKTYLTPFLLDAIAQAGFVLDKVRDNTFNRSTACNIITIHREVDG